MPLELSDVISYGLRRRGEPENIQISLEGKGTGRRHGNTQKISSEAVFTKAKSRIINPRLH
jgi:hypothetical protein